MMITRSTCAWFLCWPRHWWHTLISEKSLKTVLWSWWFSSNSQGTFASGSISCHLLWASDKGPIPVSVPVWVPIGSVGSSGGDSHWLKDDWQAEEEETLQVQGGLSWHVEVRFCLNLHLQNCHCFFRRRFPSPESEPCLKEKLSSTFPSLSRLRNAIRM